MKTTVAKANAYYACKTPGACRYPNAAERRNYLEKIVDGALAAAITLATIVIVMVLLTM